MAIFKSLSGASTRLREGANAPAAGREPQIKRMQAFSVQPDGEMGATMPISVTAPVLRRRPGLAARWKGQHRLAIPG